MDQLSKEKVFNQSPQHSNRNSPASLATSPRGLHISLEGGLNDLDLMAICNASPIDKCVDKITGL